MARRATKKTGAGKQQLAPGIETRYGFLLRERRGFTDEGNNPRLPANVTLTSRRIERKPGDCAEYPIPANDPRYGHRKRGRYSEP